MYLNRKAGNRLKMYRKIGFTIFGFTKSSSNKKCAVIVTLKY